MPTPAERQALFFLAAVAALGVGVRACRLVQKPAVATDARAALAEQIARVDSAVTVSGERKRAARADPANRQKQQRVPSNAPRNAPPNVPPNPTPNAPTRAAPSVRRAQTDALVIDVDVADAAALERLPGIGPALAARIVEDRSRLGPFGSFEALELVRGIGPAMIERLRPHVTFSAPPRLLDAEATARTRRRHP